ncbi:Do/DeqQ family serine protease [Pseudoxanthomonas sp. GM95]|uniref:Do family serine endopeptidase n=1 Tax=Pseudoxanthomonas sp. GM95 TaxID=1881043 RepID=UPI0008C549F8|nr:Do family serine endopeptidase [Pseudoxanthomonas sp. GM95]SEL51239.1 Do/DeqQ family serine protease [Pseudoxanthomonas sp. GM95]
MRPLPTLLALTAAAAFGGFVALGLYQALDRPALAREDAPPSSSILPTTAAAALPAAVEGQPLPSLAPMLKRVTPAVVSVYSRQTVRVASPLGPFAELFGVPSMPRERVQRALGSGVVIDAQRGLILTNHHVVENADGVSVTLGDGRTVEAEFLGSDPDTDVALIRIPAKDLTQIPLGDSDQLQVGDFVVAVGNPYGLGQTVTSGIVSAVGRSGIPVAGFQNFIQTDASINPGNSGGALVNLQGQLVGINTASFNPSGSMAGNIGLGFAIPIDLARNIAEQLYTNKGVVRRGTLGVTTQDVTQRLADGLGLDTPGGALITGVYPGSAGAAAGLQAGDVVLQANGQRITNGAALHNFEGLQGVGSKVTLDVRRDGKALKLDATLKEQLREVSGATLDARLTGATFDELDEATRQQLRGMGANGGVQVGTVTERSRAWNSGLRSGDIVYAGSTGNFTDLASFRSGFSKPPAQLLLNVWRDGTGEGRLLMR